MPATTARREPTASTERSSPDLGRLDAYRYELPSELIARAPADPPDAARLLVAHADGSLADRRFTDFPQVLRPGDLLVVNETQVVRARLRGTREPGGGAAEILLLHPAGSMRFDLHAQTWVALVRPGRHLRSGARVRFGDAGALTVTAVAEDGTRTVAFDADVDLGALMERFGELPLPPYVGPGDQARAARYQTTFARVPGSVAAPTASLHFTPDTLDALQQRGVHLAPLELQVGMGTFKPVETERIVDHTMHAERYAISPETARAVADAKRDGRRVVAAGTTVLRALESAALRAADAGAVQGDGGLATGEGETALFVTPGFAFRIVDALLTNFHLPGSTLLMLVAAFAGYERTMELYRHAIAERYRFFSFGDATFIEPLDRSSPARSR